MRVLVVSAVANLREVLNELLAYLGYEVSSVASAELALAWLEQHTTNLVLTDLRMPEGMWGLQFMQRVRVIGHSWPIILMTGSSPTPEYRKVLMDAGANWILDKPFEIEEMEEALKRLLTKAPSSA